MEQDANVCVYYVVGVVVVRVSAMFRTTVECGKYIVTSYCANVQVYRIGFIYGFIMANKMVLCMYACNLFESWGVI